MRRTIALLLLALLGLSQVGWTSTPQQTRPIRIGVYENAPKIYTAPDGTVSGFWPDLIRYIAAREGWQLLWVHGTWEDGLARLAANTIDIMPDTGWTEERSQMFAFSNETVLLSWSNLYVPKGSSIQSILDLQGKTIAGLAGSINLDGPDGIKDLTGQFGVRSNFVEMPDYDHVFEALDKKQVDAGITNRENGDLLAGKYNVVSTPIIFQPARFQFAFTKNAALTPYLIETIDSQMASLRADPHSIYYQALDQDLGERSSGAVVEVTPGWLKAVLPLGGGIIVFLLAVGITSRVQVQRQTAELRESEERYRTLARISPVGIFHTDSAGLTTYVSPMWCRITGLSAEEALGEGWLKAVHPEDREKLVSDWQKSRELHDVSLADYRFVRPDGTLAWVMGQAAPEMDADHQVAGYVGTITDITERKQDEAALQRSAAELEQRVAERTAELAERVSEVEKLNGAMRAMMEDLKTAVETAKSADQLKSAFLATMSHELRTPLNSIIGFTGILLMGLVGPLNDEQKKQLGMVQRSSRHLLDLINDVLDISKIEAGQVEILAAPFDLNMTLQKCIGVMAPLAEKKGLALTAEVAPQLGEIVSDQRRVEQILLNLLSNAVKFTQQGEVRLECRVEDGRLVTRVSDTGIGIKPEDMAVLFRPFRQIDSGITRQFDGTGLGLSICKRLVELLGGTIGVESQWGQGSTFTFTLPLERGAP